MKYHQGKFTPTRPDKYVGDVTNIIFRSGWERKMFIWLDTNESVLKWNSEDTVIPYISPVDNRPHRYFVDVTFMYKDKSGAIKKALVEIKPDKQTRMPVQPKRVTKKYLEDVKTYAVNQAKWEAARSWCSKHGMEFHLITEQHLNV